MNAKDYRDYYYPFGSPYDFDNYEIWNKTINNSSEQSYTTAPVR